MAGIHLSIIADEATDVGQKEQLCLAIRWVDKSFQILESPIELIQVPKTDAKTLATLIKDSLIRLALPISQCRGQAYDGAANMSGHISGVAALIQQVKESALYVHYLGHCTNLCLQTTAKRIPSIHESLKFVMGLGQLIRFSPKRCSLFETLQQQFAPGAPSLKLLCPTRWTVRTKAIEAVLSNYSFLQRTLEEIQTGKDEYALKAVRYGNTMCKFSTFFGLKLSYLIFSATEQLSTILQAKNTSLQEAVRASQLAIQYIQRQRLDTAFDTFYEQALSSSTDLTDPPALLRFRKSSSFSGPKQYYHSIYFEALDTVGNELQQRF